MMRYPQEIFRTLSPTAASTDGAGVGELDPGVSRRQFFRITSTVGGGLALALALPGCGKGTPEEPPAPATETAKAALPPATGEPFAPNAFVEIKPDNTVTVTVAMSEMGQSIRTTLALLIAEEMDLDWSKVQIHQAPGDRGKYGRQETGGSGSVRRNWKRLREAGAQARAMLVAAAGHSLGADAKGLTTRDSHVIDPASNRRVPYGEIAAAAAKQTVPEQVPLKAAKDYRLLGKEHVGIDVKDIIQGQATYGMDVRVPGMLYASIARCPVFGGKVKSFDAAQAMQVPGVKKVVEVPAVGIGIHVRSGVAVIADNTWTAMKGRAALKIEWDEGPHAKENSADYSKQMRALVATYGKELVNTVGAPGQILSAAKPKDVIRRQYELPFLAHATMEPMNCTAHVQGDKCRVWGGIQFPDWAAESIASAADFRTPNIEINIPLLGGGFGRRINPDAAVEAVLVAKQVDAPVQVLWTREDDIQHEFYRPSAVHTIEATLDKDGYPAAWRHRISTPAIGANYGIKKDFGLQESVGASNMLYRVPTRSCEYSILPSGVTRGWWRGVHTTHTVFAVESFIDELAEKANKDAYEYRMHLIDKLTVMQPRQNPDFPFVPERLKGVLKAAAEKGGWGTPLPDGHARGIACGIDHLSYAAEVVEVAVAGDQLKVNKVVCVADCGPVLNPNSARAQIEGGIIQALSAVLKEKITIRGGRVEQGNFDTYPILRIDEVPVAIEAHFVETDAHPTGLGEPSVPPLAPALASAIYRATGQRARTLPIQVSALSRG